MTDANFARIAVPIGDPAGIGPEIVLRAVADRAVTDAMRITVVGDPDALRRHAAACGLALELESDRLRVGNGDFVGLNPISAPTTWRFGEVGAAAGWACREFAVAAIEMVREGKADAVVAAPHTEAAVNMAGFRFRGYPGLVAELTGTPGDRVFLLLLSPVYRVVNVTLHEPLAAAIARIDTELVLAAIRAAHSGLKACGLPSPRIAVCGINPHAGEGGLMGTEDMRIVAPAVELARAEGLRVDGPASADALFAGCAHDVYVAMYHDQGHIPVKAASPLDASAITVGTPVPFGSVAHGSAMDIAGQGVANPRALKRALLNLAMSGR